MTTEGKSSDEESKIHKKEIGKLYGLGKPNIGDDNDSGDDDEFEELLSNIDYVEGELESIRDSLSEMRIQITQLRKKFGALPRRLDKKHHNSPNGARNEKPKPVEDDFEKVLQLSLKEQ